MWKTEILGRELGLHPASSGPVVGRCLCSHSRSPSCCCQAPLLRLRWAVLFVVAFVIEVPARTLEVIQDSERRQTPLLPGQS